jgi:hypothetical protein
MPLDAWILLLLSVGLGLGLEVAFISARKRGGYVAEPSPGPDVEQDARRGAGPVAKGES